MGCLQIVINNYEAIFFSVLLQLVFHCTNNIFDFLAEKFEKSVTGNLGALSLLLNALLSLYDLGDCGIVVLKVSSWFPVVQVNQHIRQIRTQLGLGIVQLLLRLV